MQAMAQRRSPIDRRRRLARRLIIAFYGIAGVAHLLVPDTFLAIMPGWVPYPYEVVLITGICEIAGAIGLAVPATRRSAGLMLALYALCVFPANVVHATDALASAGAGLSLLYHGPRLALQPAIIWWALFAGGLVTWPFRRQAA